MRKGELKREQILSCAGHVFSNKGYYETQMADIATASRTAKGTIYEYFGSKEHIFITLIEQYIQQWEEKIAENMDDYKADKPSRDLALAFIRRRFYKTIEFFSSNVDRCRVILRTGPALNQGIEPAINLFEDKVLAIIKSDLELGKRQGLIRDDVHNEILSNAILGSILRLGFYYFVQKKGDFLAMDLNTFIDQCVTLIENTIGLKDTGKV